MVPWTGDNSLLATDQGPLHPFPKSLPLALWGKHMGTKFVPESSAGGSGAPHQGLWAPFPLGLLGTSCSAWGAVTFGPEQQQKGHPR